MYCVMLGECRELIEWSDVMSGTVNEYVVIAVGGGME